MKNGTAGNRIVKRICTFLPLFALAAVAWGPHPDITRAALSTISSDDPIIRVLGSEKERLPDYSWMPDWSRTLVAVGNDRFYADDFLLFPQVPKGIGHMCPDVKKAFEPYFNRALQAIRTETAPNAARWIGTLVHYIEDLAAPCHAFPTKGDVHSKMENWIDGKAVRIDGYKPQLLGDDDESALEGLLDNMAKLESFCRPLGEKIKALSDADDRAGVERLAQENARAAARAVADVLHTLGNLAGRSLKGGAALCGEIASVAVPGLEKVPAKVMLDKTDFSTLADANGQYEFRNLPPKRYRFLVTRPGSELFTQGVVLEEDDAKTNNVAMKQADPAGNPVRNADFSLRWVDVKAPDMWRFIKQEWEGEAIPVTAGRKVRLLVSWKQGAGGEVVLRWRNTAAGSGGQFKSEPAMKPGEDLRIFTVPEGMRYARLLVVTRGDPKTVCERVSLVPD